MIEGLSHITLIASDLDRMSAIVEQVLDGREVYSSGDDTFSLSREKFFIVGGQWIAVMEGEPSGRSYNHVAFKVDETDLPDYRRRLVGWPADWEGHRAERGVQEARRWLLRRHRVYALEEIGLADVPRERRGRLSPIAHQDRVDLLPERCSAHHCSPLLSCFFLPFANVTGQVCERNG